MGDLGLRLRSDNRMPREGRLGYMELVFYCDDRLNHLLSSTDHTAKGENVPTPPFFPTMINLGCFSLPYLCTLKCRSLCPLGLAL